MPSQTKERSLYRDLLRGAGELTWHRKEFWVLGLFAALLGNGGAIDVILRAANKFSSAYPFLSGLAYTRSIITVITTGTFAERATILITLLIGAAFIALAILFSISALGGIFFATSKRTAKKRVTMREAFAHGAARFMPLFAVQALGRTTTFALLAFTVVGFFGSSYLGSVASLLYLILFIVFAIAALLVSFLVEMASAAIAIDGLEWPEAFTSAYRLLTRHWLVSIEMIAFLFLIDILFTAFLFIVALTLTIPFFLLFLVANILGSAIGFIIVIFLAALAGLALLLAGGGALATFEHSAWSLLYLRLSNRGAIAKIERLWRALRTHA